MRNCAVEIYSHTCLRCHHSWNPRKVNPKICPKCKSKKWDIPKAVRNLKGPVLALNPGKLNLTEASGLLGLAPATFKSWVASGRIEEYRDYQGARPFYSKDEILKLFYFLSRFEARRGERKGKKVEGRKEN